MSWPAADRRDIDKVNNPMTVAELQAYAPGLNWDAYLTASGITAATSAIVAEKTAIKEIAALYDATPLATLKAWEAFHVADQASPYLSKRFVDSRFAFTKTLSGVTALRPRWKRGVGLIDTTLGELLGRTYVDTYFPAVVESDDDRVGRQPEDGDGARASRQRLDGWRRNEEGSAREAGEDGRDGRLSGQVARLLGLKVDAGRSLRQRRSARTASSGNTSCRISASRSIGRSGG